MQALKIIRALNNNSEIQNPRLQHGMVLILKKGRYSGDKNIRFFRVYAAPGPATTYGPLRNPAAVGTYAVQPMLNRLLIAKLAMPRAKPTRRLLPEIPPSHSPHLHHLTTNPIIRPSFPSKITRVYQFSHKAKPILPFTLIARAHHREPSRDSFVAIAQ
jgi:hypothetical protein